MMYKVTVAVLINISQFKLLNDINAKSNFRFKKLTAFKLGLNESTEFGTERCQN